MSLEGAARADASRACGPGVREGCISVNGTLCWRHALPALKLPRNCCFCHQVEDVGIYMPHTTAGAVLVDGVVATQLTTTAPQVGCACSKPSSFVAPSSASCNALLGSGTCADQYQPCCHTPLQWLAHHRIGRPCILALRKLLALLPSFLREPAVNSQSLMVHGVPAGLWAGSVL